ncbi:hypothetical protein CRENBAI_006705 [Crenichthys baileyi]|uniref:Uncharacterized protein n=1 Tax=Crenichthys baileyi TaxID=28760 RepID=A0AAV9QTX8_9TELE
MELGVSQLELSKQGSLKSGILGILPEERHRDWTLEVYSERYLDQMSRMGYFPAPMVKETQKFTDDTIRMQTTDMDFYCD